MFDFLGTPLLTFLLLIGTYFTATLLKRLFAFLYLYFLKPSSLYQCHRGKRIFDTSIASYIPPPPSPSGAWALVTGASDGIGFRLSQELAREGFNVLLHGRNQSKLDSKISQLRNDFPRLTFQTVIADATDTAGMQKNIQKIVKTATALPGPLTVLINNAGGTPMLEYRFTTFKEYRISDIDAVIDLNTRFVVQLTSALLPALESDEGTSLILNVSSVAGTTGAPYTSVYGGTKAFLISFSLSLADELKFTKSNIEVLCLVVAMVTDTARTKKASYFMPTATDFAKAALTRVGCGRTVVTAFWAHAVQFAVLDLLPRRFFTDIVHKLAAEMRAEQAKVE